MTPADRLRELGLVDPTHRPEPVRRRAPRLESLKGRRGALLDNRKGNADRLLQAIGELLVERYDVGEVDAVRKFIYSRRADPQVIDDLVRDYDFVVTAVGD